MLVRCARKTYAAHFANRAAGAVASSHPGRLDLARLAAGQLDGDGLSDVITGPASGPKARVRGIDAAKLNLGSANSTINPTAVLAEDSGVRSLDDLATMLRHFHTWFDAFRTRFAFDIREGVFGIILRNHLSI